VRHPLVTDGIMRPLSPDFDALVINGGQWTLAFAEANRPSTSAEERLANFLRDVDDLIAALLASSHAADLRQRVFWRSITPLEWLPERHRPPYNNMWLRRADLEAKRKWREAGFKVIDTSKYLRHAYYKPDFAANASLMFTYDSIHTHAWVSWAMAREIFHLVYQDVLLPEFAAVRLKLTGGAE
jgi:hypothetical protein